AQDRIIAGAQLRPVPAQDWPYQPPNKLQRAIQAACRALIEADSRLTELDRVVGDGDLGINLARGARAVEETQLLNPADALNSAAHTLQQTVGGSSGAFYAVALLRAAASLRARNMDDPRAWAQASLEACDAISELGGANAGDRTMLDALLPFANTFSEGLDSKPTTQALDAAVRAAEAGAAATAQMMPRRGRSSYLGERVIGHPDPGAVAVAIWLRAVSSQT
ncbi:MAG: dihydroxyacetone kinase subunit DhaL, partial [Bryobacteraceae bacterium]